MKKNFLMLLDGMTGSGKTTISQLLKIDLPRTAIFGMDKVKRFVSDFERGEKDNAIARNVVFKMSESYLEQDISVIIEQPFKNEEEIKQYEKLADKHGVENLKFQLFTRPDVALKRVTDRTRAIDSDLTEERILRNISLFKDRSNVGFTTIDTSDINPEEVSKIILEKINIS